MAGDMVHVGRVPNRMSFVNRLYIRLNVAGKWRRQESKS